MLSFGLNGQECMQMIPEVKTMGISKLSYDFD